MPIYEYECTSCHHHFDVIQKINDDPIQQCPSCQQNTVVKLISAAGFQLKGTGWYATDFKNKSSPKSNDTTSDTKTTEPAKTTKGDSE